MKQAWTSYHVDGEQCLLPRRYTPIKLVGVGTYGFVFAARDQVNNTKVAIKKIKDLFNRTVNARRILREIRMLKHFTGIGYVNGLLDVFVTPDHDNFEDLYIVTEYMQSDLFKIMHSKNTLSSKHVGFIGYQLLLGLHRIRAAGVMHRDIKPQNILVNADCKIKITDFGLSRSINEEELQTDDNTEYVVTRWYRAPEIIVSGRNYGFGVDMWSIGCVIGEMFNHEAIFQGKNHIHQLQTILEVVGTPSPEDLDSISYVKGTKEFISKLPMKKPLDFAQVFPNAPETAVDLLRKMLQFNPEKRISIDDALRHPFFLQFHREQYLQTTPPRLDFDFDSIATTREHIRSMILEFVDLHRSDSE